MPEEEEEEDDVDDNDDDDDDNNNNDDQPTDHTNAQQEGDQSTASVPTFRGIVSRNPFYPPQHTIVALRNPLPFIREMRQTLFDVAAPIDLKVEEFHRYWPYMDNIWIRVHRGGKDAAGNWTTEYYVCRLQRATYHPRPADDRGEDIERDENGNPLHRRKRIRVGGSCQCRIKVVRLEGLVKCLRVQKSGPHEHSHDLKHGDKVKRNSVIMDLTRAEVMRGYMPSSVYTVLHEDKDKLAAIGGQFMNRNDIRNTSQAWRSKFKGQLGSHPGYTYDASDGIAASAIDPLKQLVPPTNIPNHKEHLNIVNSRGILPVDTLFFPPSQSSFLTPYLPSSQPPRQQSQQFPNILPYITLTYATSLDSYLSVHPSVPTPISGPLSKSMTHHLRASHDAILIGAGTAISDNPTLNCRIAGAGGYGGLGWSSHPRPIIIDPTARWNITYNSAMLTAARAGRGKGPWIIVGPGVTPPADKLKLLSDHGGKYLALKAFDARYRLAWTDILRALGAEGIKSVMVEGGATVINDLLGPENLGFVDCVVLTVAAMYLGRGGVGVAPLRGEYNHQNHPAPPPPAAAAAGAASGGDSEGRKDGGGGAEGSGDNSGSNSGSDIRRERAPVLPPPAIKFKDVKWQIMGGDVVMCGRVREAVVE